MRTNGLSIAALLVCTLVLLTACIGDGEDRVLSIEATGRVQGLVFLDENGDFQFAPPERGMPNVGVRLIVPATTDTLAGATTNADGLFSMSGVDVGTYDIVVAASTLADTVQVVNINPPQVVVAPNDSVASTIIVGFPRVSVSEARELPPGIRVFVDGIMLNGRDTYGDNTVHIGGQLMAIRATRVQPTPLAPGDNGRFLGATHMTDGQPTIDAVEVFLLATGQPPTPTSTTTGGAATAELGLRDAALVRVTDATINTIDLPPNQDGVMTVDDGSGPLVVVLDADIPFTGLESLTTGTVIDVVGVLVPTPGVAGSWQLKPRGDADITLSG